MEKVLFVLRYEFTLFLNDQFSRTKQGVKIRRLAQQTPPIGWSLSKNETVATLFLFMAK